ncbi:FadR/GntR family transcriptional regulator [Elstera cyanobacteriorum]|uniref:FadR/GntR family transcriptional regulator n=1 Tax=Elstera cyanobacteriorum TaxID=2022747 RepID=UPI0023541319|nr:FadR/GntR family transcriptional regulator [Elstera cyanobacteriorum]MCK6441541.1 FadR family transcriptional regulator [Elstera cyanobacteriorum]
MADRGKRTYSRRSLHGKVAHMLGTRILSGDYAPGALLPNEETLSAELGVSRTALREAIKVLASKGLIESRPKIGTRVRPAKVWNLLDPDILAWSLATRPALEFVGKFLELREMVEPGAAALAARNHTPDQAKAMQEAFDAMAAAPDIDAWNAADVRFHQALMAATGNEFVASLGGLIDLALTASFDFTAKRAVVPRRGLPFHGQVLARILARDAEGARDAALALLHDARATVAEISAVAP